jgi:hypothetical protein
MANNVNAEWLSFKLQIEEALVQRIALATAQGLQNQMPR